MAKIKFLEDDPSLIEDVQFGHQTIVNTLKKIVEETETPSHFTIGLFGKWGSGKSVIIHRLKEYWNNESSDKKTTLVLFDVWKHQGDSLRRTFLTELLQQLKNNGRIKKNISLSRNVYFSYRDDFTEGLRFNKYLLKDISIYVICIILFGIPLNEFFYWSGIIPDFALKVVIPVIISFVTAFFGSLLYLKHVKVTKDKFSDPHQFENEFKRILGEIDMQTTNLVIVFDNLDRLNNSNKVQEIISTIKTFLEPKNIREGLKVCCLIPCDNDALRKHLDKKVKANEYLRKFFNVTFSIPQFHHDEFEDYIRKLLIKTEIREFNDEGLIWLLTKEFRGNPRKAIQFINSLISYYILLECNEKLKKEPIVDLGKYLIIKYYYSDLFEKLLVSGINNLSSDNLKKIEGIVPIASKFLDETNHILIPCFNIYHFLSRFTYLNILKFS